MQRVAEDRGLGDCQPDVEADDDQGGAGEKGNPPAELKNC